MGMNKKAEVIWANVWTSKGKALKGDIVVLPDSEIAALASIGAVHPEKKAAPKKARKARLD